MNIFHIFRKGDKKRPDDNAELYEALEKGSYYDAVEAAGALIGSGDYSRLDTMIARMTDHRMAEKVSRIPDERVILPLILSVSRYALLNLSVSAGSEKYDIRSVKTIFRNLVNNFRDRVFPYLSMMADYSFFVTDGDRLYFTAGRRSILKNHLDRPDHVAGCAREVLKDIPEERLKKALEEHGDEFVSAFGSGLKDSDIHEMLMKEPY